MPALATWQLPSRRGKLTQHHVMTLHMSGTNAVCCHTASLAARAGKDAAVEGTLLASGLGFPEGPVVMPDGAIVLCDGNTGQLLRWSDGAMSTFADTGGSPWGAILGTDGAIYVTQGGNVPGSGDQQRRAGHPARQRGRHASSCSRSSIAGHDAGRPERPRVRPRRPAVVHRLGHRAGRPLRPALARAAVRARRVGRRRAWCSSGRTSTRTASRSTRRAACTGPSRWRTRVCRLDDGEADGLLPADRRPRAGRHGVRRGRPAVRVHDDLGGPDGASPPRARCSRRSRSASTRPTASSTARRCT